MSANVNVKAIATFDEAAKSIIGGGSSITLTATVITPSENAQTVTASEGTAFSTVTVEAIPTPTV